MKRFQQTCVLLGLLLVAISVRAQAELNVSEVNVLALSNNASARIFPSPDARWVVYDSSVRRDGHVDRYLTLTSVEPDDQPRDYAKPEDITSGYDTDPNSYYVPFAWSPDSGRVAAVAQPLITHTDSDLWIFDVANESFTNLTDDGYDGPLTEEGPPPAGTSIEIQPAWSPDGTRIAVERSVIGEDGQFGPAAISVMDASSGEVTELAPIPGEAGTGATTGMAWSPDGAWLALTLWHSEPDTESDGLWVVDVNSGEPRRVLGLNEIETALQNVISDLPLTGIGPVFWSLDSQRLLIWAGKTEGTPVQVWPFVVDVDAGTIESAPVPAHPNDTPARRSLRPLQVAWSPDGQRLLMFTFGLHPDEDKTALDPANASARGAVRVMDVATGDGQLLGYLPLGPAVPLYYAAWGSDGDLIIDGYHLAVSE